MTGEVAPPRLRITVVVSHLVPTLGTEAAALGLVAALEQTADVRLVSLAGGSADVAIRPGTITAGPRALTGLRRLATLWRAPRLLRGDSSDARVLVGAPAAGAVLLTGRARSTDVVWEHSLSEARLQGSVPLRLVWAVLRRLYARVGAVVAVSPPVADLVRTSGVRTELVPNAAPAPADGPGPVDRDPGAPVRLLAVGRLTPLKNHREIVDALVVLPGTTRLSIVGEGPERDALVAQAARLGVADRVELLGHLDSDAVRDAMDSATLLVHPSRSETFGLVYLEAAERRLPVVSIDHPAARWLVPHYVPGVLAQHGHLAEGVSALLAAMPDDAAWRASSAARSADMDPAGVARRWDALLHEVVARRG